MTGGRRVGSSVVTMAWETSPFSPGAAGGLAVPASLRFSPTITASADDRTPPWAVSGTAAWGGQRAFSFCGSRRWRRVRSAPKDRHATDRRRDAIRASMSNLARHWIAAIQNSLLGDLLTRVWPMVLFFQWGTYKDGHYWVTVVILGVYLCIVVLAVLAWALGFMAIHERPKGRLALERIQDAPRNGFEVWSKPPAGGLKPPQLTKAVVMRLGDAVPREAVCCSVGSCCQSLQDAAPRELF